MNATPALDDFAQRGRWRSFEDPVVETRYRAWHRDQITTIARGLGVGVVLLWGSIPAWFALFVGYSPPVLWVSAWGITVPVVAALIVASYTSLRGWVASHGISLVTLVVGLNFIWLMTRLYGPVSGAASCAALASVFLPLVIRLPTVHAVLLGIILSGVPAVLQIAATVAGKVRIEDSWPYIAIPLTSMPLVIIGAAQIETSMRRQFAAQRLASQQHEQLEVSQRLIRRYAPAAVTARIESGDAETVGIPQRLRVTALSSDIAGFTVLADRLDPESLSHIINEYVGAMSGIVEGQGGVITEFAGDGLMAIFGAPERIEPVDQVRQAVSAARAMHDRLAELNSAWGPLGVDQPLRVRIGINTGVLSVGTFGSDGRATYTAIGLQMNIAARIQAQCEPGKTLLSSTSWHAVKDEVPCDLLAEVQVKGVHFPINVYQPR